MFCELFVNHSFLGHKIKDNVYFIAECNPYRLNLSNQNDTRYINNKKNKIKNLVYNVNPLPSALINYAMDFGYIKKDVEKGFIEKLMNVLLNNKFSLRNNNNYQKILNIIIDSVHEAQNFIKINSEISDVSLRDVNRFKILFEFFFYLTKERYEFKNPDFSKKKIILFSLRQIMLKKKKKI